MFRKIVSNLPYHPAVLDQVGFYLHRLRQEDSIRRTGLVLTVLVIIVQMFVIISPSKPSLATSTNDLIYGVTSKEQIIQAYNNNRDSLGRTDIRAIYNHYGIGPTQIAASQPQRIGSGQKNFVSTGRGTSPGVDTFINIPGVGDGGIYQRPLRSWDTNRQQNWYNTLTGMSNYGFRFWLIIDGCGNIVFEENTLVPNLNIIKKSLTGTTAGPGDLVKYSIQFQNSGLGTAKNLTINDNLPNEFTYASYTSNVDLVLSQSGQSLTWKVANSNSQLPPSQRWYNIDITLRVKNISASKNVCNSASIGANGFTAKLTDNSNDARCINITVPTCPGTGLPIPAGGVSACQVTCPDGSVVSYDKACTEPQLSCQYLKIISAPAWDSRKFETAILMQKGAVPKQINYYVNNVKVSTLPVISGTISQLYTHKFNGAGSYQIRAELSATTGLVQPSQGCQITEKIVKPKTTEPRINTDKTVENLTQKISDANGTTAMPGDKLKYTIIISNSGDASYDGLKLEGDYGESINDVLEYSSLVDYGGAKYNDKTNFLSWGTVNIDPGETIKKSFIVQVKNPLPSTPTSASDPLSYDFNMQNRYGRLIVVHLNKPVTKIVEQTVKELPNTGPGTSITLSVFAAVIIGYFFYRGRLLSRELEIVHHSYSAGGL